MSSYPSPAYGYPGYPTPGQPLPPGYYEYSPYSQPGHPHAGYSPYDGVPPPAGTQTEFPAPYRPAALYDPSNGAQQPVYSPPTVPPIPNPEFESQAEQERDRKKDSKTIPAFPTTLSTSTTSSKPIVGYLGALVVDPASSAAKPGERTVAGYDPKPHYDKMMDDDTSAVEMARIILSMTLAQRDAFKDYFTKTSGYQIVDILGGRNKQRALDGILLGPLDYDVVLARNLVGKGEMLLIELTLHRPSHELRILSQGYRDMFEDDLAEDIMTDDNISVRVRRLCAKAVQVERPPDHIPIDPSLVTQDVESLVKAEDSGDDKSYFEIFIKRSYRHIAAVIAEFERKQKKKLKKAVKKTLGTEDGMAEAITYMIRGIKPKKGGQDGSVWRDAKLLEATMKGWGTRDGDLIYRLTRARWNPYRFHAIKEVYEKKYDKSLARRIKGDTSGEYREILIMMLHSSDS